LAAQMKRLLPSALLLILVSWIVVGLVASGGVITWGNPLNPEAIDLLSALTRNLVSVAFLGFMVLTLVLMVINRRILVGMLKQAIIGSGSASRRHSSLLRSMLSLVGFLVPFLIFYYLRVLPADYEGVDTSPLLPPSGKPAGDGNFTSTPWPFLPQPSASTSLIVGYASGIIVLVIAVVGALLVFQAVRETSWGYEEPPQDTPEEALKESALLAVQEAIHGIEEEDFRMAVIKCYRRLCETLEEHGVPSREHQTAREYESKVSDVLDIPTDPLSVLTELFEEARYSLHEIGQKEQNRALSSLVYIRDRLSGVSADV